MLPIEAHICLAPSPAIIHQDVTSKLLQSPTFREIPGKREYVFCVQLLVYQLTLRFTWKVLRCGSPFHGQRVWEYVQKAWREPGISVAVIFNFCQGALANNGQGRKVVKNSFHKHTHERASLEHCQTSVD